MNLFLQQFLNTIKIIKLIKFKQAKLIINYSIVFFIILSFNSCSSPTLEVSSLDLTNLNGENIQLNEYKDKVLFVNFWATWCKPCLEEFPSIVRTQKIMQPKGYQFLFVSDESVSVIESFSKKKPYNFTYLKSNKAIAEYGIYSLPVTYIIANGEVLGTLSGGYRWDTPGNLKLLEDFLKP